MTQVALVTGSSKGIGKATALRLAKDGYHVYVTYLTDEQGGNTTVQEIENNGGAGTLVKLDVRDEENIKNVFTQIKNNHGHLNVLVNNAGKEIPKKIEELSLEEWKTVIDTGIDGLFLTVKYGLPLMKHQENANLIIISSSLGSNPEPDYPAYCVREAATDAFAKMMALDLPQYSIRTNVVLPGTTRTNMWDTLGSDDALWEKLAKSNVMGRVSTPEYIANTISMIINDENKYLNGNFIYVDGGNHLKTA